METPMTKTYSFDQSVNRQVGAILAARHALGLRVMDADIQSAYNQVWYENLTETLDLKRKYGITAHV